MLRLLIWLTSGFWWTPERECRASCNALRSSCTSGFCLMHCTKHCYCGVGKSFKELS